MISIAMLRGGAARAAYYVERAAECGPADYYTHELEPAGRWCGRGAAALGLERVPPDQAAVFAGLLDGVLPDGTQVARPVLRQDPNGPDGGRVDVRRCGLDLVVSAPKSVSVLAGLADPAIATAVTAAHDRAVTEALGYLDRHAGHGLRGHQGGDQRATRVETEGLIAAAFTHHTSRADDPQLHTHLVIANLVHGTDGKWSSVDSRAMHRHARTAGCVYQAVLRGELTRTLGVGWGPVRRGVAEITGIPKTLITEFSTRRKAIEDELDRTGTSGRKAAQRAAYVTRPAKSHLPEAPLRQQWATRAAEAGHAADQVVAQSLRHTQVPDPPALEELAAELLGPDGLTGQATSFDRRDVVQALTEAVPVGVPVTGNQLETVADRLLADDQAVPLLNPATRDGDRRWSTRDLLAAENRAIMLSAVPTAVPAMTRPEAIATLARRDLSPEQHAVIVGLLISPHLLDLVVGPAGSGKTAALRAAADTWRAHGIPVIGCSLAAVTARRLETATGVPCASITRTLADLDRTDPATGRPAGLAPQTVVLVDEASMVGTRHQLRLLTHVRAAGGKVVLVGDPAQLSEVDAGGLFTALARHHQPLTLTGNQRQTNPWERDALLALRDGRTDQALAAYLTQDRIHIGETETVTQTRLARHYAHHRQQLEDPYAVVALASTRRDTHQLNTLIRLRLHLDGELAPDQVTVPGEDGDRAYATGDLVIVTRNDHQVGLLNGTRATLTHADRDQLTLRTDTGHDVTVPTGWATEHLDHGYAMTVHKAQGFTTSVALLYGTDTLSHQAGYVGLSRGRDANYLFTSQASLQPDRAGLEIAGPTDHRRIETTEITRTLAELLSRDRRHTLARDQQPQQDPYPWLTRHDPGRYTGRSM